METETSGGDIHEKDGVSVIAIGCIIDVRDSRRDPRFNLNDRVHGRPELPSARRSGLQPCTVI
jgi:hypothetical protein